MVVIKWKGTDLRMASLSFFGHGQFPIRWIELKSWYSTCLVGPGPAENAQVNG